MYQEQYEWQAEDYSDDLGVEHSKKLSKHMLMKKQTRDASEDISFLD